MDSKRYRNKSLHMKINYQIVELQGSETIRFELETAIKLHLSQET